VNLHCGANADLLAGDGKPMNNPQKARALHRNYFIDLEQNADRNWIVIAITHTYDGSSLLPPGFNYPGRALAERYAQAAIDLQLSAE